ncbi:no mechanoreceptor potential c isoform d-related [Anaeramoeba ignava]|uniref:No mechanoreceptor potential c isoform d-related n=1 Tax=Anaeramoeba ignava TaxID=1746090 RepID=A0A9Q0LP41_ANAIG|nr:no mechanoreceptor potential c isoform d-related [Anaeramoeba ignava]
MQNLLISIYKHDFESFQNNFQKTKQTLNLDLIIDKEIQQITQFSPLTKPFQYQIDENGNEEIEQNYTLVLFAAQQGGASILRFLKKNKMKNFEVETTFGNNCLHLSSLNGKLGCVKKLIRYGFSTKKTNRFQETALHMAIKKGHKEIIEYFINKNFEDQEGHNCFTLCIQLGSIKWVEEILKTHPNIVKKRDGRGWSGIHYACFYKHHYILYQLLNKGADFNQKTNDGKQLSPLHLACQAGFLKGINLLILTYNANVNCFDSARLTPLHYTVKYNHPFCSRFLLWHHANINLITREGLKPIHIAAQHNSFDCFLLLLEQDFSSLFKLDLFGNFLIVHFIKNGNFSSIKKLLGFLTKDETFRKITNQEREQSNRTTKNEESHHNPSAKWSEGDANRGKQMQDKENKVENENFLFKKHSIREYIEHKNYNGWSALHFASEKGDVEIFSLLFSKCEGSVVDTETKHGETPLHIASRNGWTDLSLRLIELGASVNKTTKAGWTALHYAAKYGHLKIIQLLLSKGAHIDILTRFRTSPLHLAARGGHSDVATFLLEHGSSVNLKNNGDATACHLAVIHNDPKILSVLVNYGADFAIQDANGDSPAHLCVRFDSLDCFLVLQKLSVDFFNLKNSLDLSVFELAKQLQKNNFVKIIHQQKSAPKNPSNLQISTAPIESSRTNDGYSAQKVSVNTRNFSFQEIISSIQNTLESKDSNRENPLLNRIPVLLDILELSENKVPENLPKYNLLFDIFQQISKGIIDHPRTLLLNLLQFQLQMNIYHFVELYNITWEVSPITTPKKIASPIEKSEEIQIQSESPKFEIFWFDQNDQNLSIVNSVTKSLGSQIAIHYSLSPDDLDSFQDSFLSREPLYIRIICTNKTSLKIVPFVRDHLKLDIPILIYCRRVETAYTFIASKNYKNIWATSFDRIANLFAQMKRDSKLDVLDSDSFFSKSSQIFEKIRKSCLQIKKIDKLNIWGRLSIILSLQFPAKSTGGLFSRLQFIDLFSELSKSVDNCLATQSHPKLGTISTTLSAISNLALQYAESLTFPQFQTLFQKTFESEKERSVLLIGLPQEIISKIKKKSSFSNIIVAPVSRNLEIKSNINLKATKEIISKMISKEVMCNGFTTRIVSDSFSASHIASFLNEKIRKVVPYLIYSKEPFKFQDEITSNYRAGFSGDDTSKSIFPSIIGKPKDETKKDETKKDELKLKDFYIGKLGSNGKIMELFF